MVKEFADIMFIIIAGIANVVSKKYVYAGEAVRLSMTTFDLCAISLISLIMMNII